jgi:hypothetical protein
LAKILILLVSAAFSAASLAAFLASKAALSTAYLSFSSSYFLTASAAALTAWFGFSSIFIYLATFLASAISSLTAIAFKPSSNLAIIGLASIGIGATFFYSLIFSTTRPRAFFSSYLNDSTSASSLATFKVFSAFLTSSRLSVACSSFNTASLLARKATYSAFSATTSGSTGNFSSAAFLNFLSAFLIRSSASPARADCSSFLTEVSKTAFSSSSFNF